MEILKIYLQEQLPMKHLILLKIRYFGSDFGSDIKNRNMSNQELPKELRKTIIRKFEKLKVHSSFIHNIWGADLVDIQLKSKIYSYLVLLIFPRNTHELFR